MHLLLLNNVSAIIDIVALVLLGIFALYGLIKGFTKTFFSVFGSLIGLSIAILLAPSVVNFLQNKYSFVDSMSVNFNGIASGFLPKDIYNAPLSLATPETLSTLAGFIANIVLSLKNNPNVSPDATIGQAVCSILGYYAVLIVCVIALYIVLRIVFFLIGEIVKKSYQNKLVASLDRLLGFALGIVNGIFNIEIIILALSIIPIPIFQEIVANINGTVFTKFIQDINLYQIIFQNIINNNIINVILR